MYPRHSAEVIQQRVGARLERQRVLLASGEGRQFSALLDEAVLHRVAGSQDIMRAQMRSLLEMSERPNVSVQVLPFGAGVLPVTNNKFIILTFGQPAVPGVVFIESLTGDLYLDRPEDVELYQGCFRLMGQMALGEEESRGIIATVAARPR